MREFVTLQCPFCGGSLQITSDIQRFACAYCGTEHLVKRAPGVVAIEPIVDGLQNIQRGTDRTASELAIRRLKGNIVDDQQQMERIAAYLCRRDFRTIGNTLLRIKRISIIESLRRSGSSKDIVYFTGLILALSVEEMANFIVVYWANVILRTKNKKDFRSQLSRILKLKQHIASLQIEVAKHEEVLNA